MSLSILSTEIRSEHDVPLTRQRAWQIASLLGFDMHGQTRIATAVSEIARNAVQYAGKGIVEFRLIDGPPQGLQITITDHGPGIANVENLLNVKRRDGDSEPGSSLRGVRRLMDAFLIETSPQKGTLVQLIKRRPRLLPPIGPKDMGQITGALAQKVSEDPVAMMQRQNQELLHTLDELRGQEEERQANLKEIEVLNNRLRRAMTETHHRVKNNLQLITALIELQTQSGKDTVPISDFVRLGQSIHTLGIIHDILTQESKRQDDASYIPVNQVLARLFSLLQANMEPRQLVVHLNELSLPGKQATSLALIANELVSNAIKHGTGDIEITLFREGERVILEVCDDGPGFADDFDPATAANTGLELIENIAHYDLQAETLYQTRPQGGARVALKFAVLKDS